MKWILSLDEIRAADRHRVGGKCFALSRLGRMGIKVPRTICVVAEAYRHYVDATGIRERILLELNRKELKDMRWEEIWDSSLRIRNMFLKGPDPSLFFSELKIFLEAECHHKPAVVRSSASDEDSGAASFAGLHDSFVNVRGPASILDHIRLVWASLWSDAALLYRQEIGLDPTRSAMAVIVQEFIQGDESGVVFSLNPNRPHEGIIESVHGLNQGLVDGAIEPDRWIFDRRTRRITAHSPGLRIQQVMAGDQGVRTHPLPKAKTTRPPIRKRDIGSLVTLALKVEKAFGAPQDIEWTIQKGSLWVLQSRPVTTVQQADPDDNRRWYLSLRRSFENLKSLQQRIECTLIPAMIADAARLGEVRLDELSDEELAQEILRRSQIESQWTSVYWEDFIPFAHGMRLFGQVYNDVMRPGDPYEFVALLANSDLESVKRNRMLMDMAAMVRNDGTLRDRLERGEVHSADESFRQVLTEFIEAFGDLSCPVTGVIQCDQGPDALIRLVLEMAEQPLERDTPERKSAEALCEEFFARFSEDRREEARELLDLGRSSYRLRDDDNIHLARIEAQTTAAVNEANRRTRTQGALDLEPTTREALAGILTSREPSSPAQASPVQQPTQGEFTLKPRQLLGQPAGPGIARGTARVITEPQDLNRFKRSEILVCDAVDPNMTFVVPLASGIIERRGGMLIHGAIIAREYGLPCVTGIPEATRWIRTGDLVTVDGYLGIVTVGTSEVHRDSI